MADVLQKPESEQLQNVLLTQGDLSEAPTPAPDQPSRDVAPSVSSTLDHATTITDEIERKLGDDLRADEEEQYSYVPPVEDPYTRAVKYLERYNVMHVFQQLTANLVYHRPEDPLQFMLDEIVKLQKEKAGGSAASKS
ncbi:testis-specific expressed protein 55-like [Ptychodera flava]|uniref:testis-specific expressed protein 55-like n=1 Tax=Ptychodera flava TaxID=63121 RepID=UPI00396A8B66